MIETIIYILFIYLCISFCLFLIFGLVILDNDSKFRDYIQAILFMPFILVSGFIEEFKNKKK